MLSERIFAKEDIDDEEEFSGFYISHEKAAVSELIGDAKSEITLGVDKIM